MSESFVIGLDSSTQSTKAIAWNRNGEPIAEGRADIPMQNPRLDCFEQNPEDWWVSAQQALQACVQQIDKHRIDGIAISNQRETLGFLNVDGEPTYPAILWLDERNRKEVEEFSKQFGAENIHRITGRPPDLTPCLYRFIWLKQHEKAAWNDTAHFVDVQSYLVQKLCGGHYRTGWISADPMGIIDMESRTWSKPLLDVLALEESRLPEIHAPGTLLGHISQESAVVTGLAEGTSVFAAGGDGQCAGLGTNCTTPDRAYINLGTAVVCGIWSPEYRYDLAWRTELAAQGTGYIYESCLRSGAFLINWFVDQFVAKGKADSAIFNELETAASQLPIGSEGLLIQPYFSGVMNPHWDTSARGVFLGLCASHSHAHIYRAILESITLDQMMGINAMENSANQHISHLVAIGGGASSSLWLQMLADVSGKPVHVSTTIEASALGAGMIAAFGAGWYPSIPTAAENMAGSTTVVEPSPEKHRRYTELLAIYKKLYSATSSINQEMIAFAAKHQGSI